MRGPLEATSATASGSGGPVVVYEVTASGSRNTGSVSYTDQDGDRRQVRRTAVQRLIR